MKRTMVLIAALMVGFSPYLKGQGKDGNRTKGSKGIRINFDDAKSGLAKRLLSNKHITLAKGKGRDGSDAIRVAYVGYERGSQRVGARIPLGFSAEKATLSFDVCFDKDFQWKKGGKLHGLGPARPITGGKAMVPDGWSARVTFKEEGTCKLYLYEQLKESKYGSGEKTKEPVFKAGKWHHVVLQITLNTPNKKDGWGKIYVDNKLVVQSDNVCFRKVGGAKSEIRQFLFSTFHGGHQPTCAPRAKDGSFTTVYAYFDNFVVSEGIVKP